MADQAVLDNLLRGVAAGGFTVSGAVLALAPIRAPTRWIGVAFFLCAIGHVLDNDAALRGAAEHVNVIVWLLSALGPATFWLFTTVLFTDERAFPPLRLVPVVTSLCAVSGRVGVARGAYRLCRVLRRAGRARVFRHMARLEGRSGRAPSHAACAGSGGRRGLCAGHRSGRVRSCCRSPGPDRPAVPGLCAGAAVTRGRIDLASRGRRTVRSACPRAARQGCL